ncbi:MAG: hypothetical protein LBV61_08550 [Burkholderiaceae bacterium]|jgi:hypothetical protein|nr:hypothetical protein [Burkholderiaceae bacterium]
MPARRCQGSPSPAPQAIAALGSWIGRVDQAHWGDLGGLREHAAFIHAFYTF